MRIYLYNINEPLRIAIVESHQAPIDFTDQMELVPGH